jgi:hypothetical protein
LFNALAIQACCGLHDIVQARNVIFDDDLMVPVNGQLYLVGAGANAQQMQGTHIDGSQASTNLFNFLAAWCAENPMCKLSIVPGQRNMLHVQSVLA